MLANGGGDDPQPPQRQRGLLRTNREKNRSVAHVVNAAKSGTTWLDRSLSYTPTPDGSIGVNASRRFLSARLVFAGDVRSDVGKPLF